MSDIGLNFSALDILGFGAIMALPITTIILVILVAFRLRARGSGWRRGGRWGPDAGIVAGSAVRTAPDPLSALGHAVGIVIDFRARTKAKRPCQLQKIITNLSVA